MLIAVKFTNIIHEKKNMPSDSVCSLKEQTLLYGSIVM